MTRDREREREERKKTAERVEGADRGVLAASSMYNPIVYGQAERTWKIQGMASFFPSTMLCTECPIIPVT